MLSDLGRSEAHYIGCCTALGVGSTLEELESYPSFKRCNMPLTFFLPSFLFLHMLLFPVRVPLSPLGNTSGTENDGFPRLPTRDSSKRQIKL